MEKKKYLVHRDEGSTEGMFRRKLGNDLIKIKERPTKRESNNECSVVDNHICFNLYLYPNTTSRVRNNFSKVCGPRH